jgi:hypothetical protein
VVLSASASDVTAAMPLVHLLANNHYAVAVRYQNVYSLSNVLEFCRLTLLPRFFPEVLYLAINTLPDDLLRQPLFVCYLTHT